MENQRKNRRARGRTRTPEDHARTEHQPDIVGYERRLKNATDVDADQLPNPAWVDDRSGRPGPSPAPGRKSRFPQKRG